MPLGRICSCMVDMGRRSRIILFAVLLLCLIIVGLHHSHSKTLDGTPKTRGPPTPIESEYRIGPEPGSTPSRRRSQRQKPREPAYGNTAAECPKEEAWGSFCRTWLSSSDREKADHCLQMTMEKLNLSREGLEPYLPCSCRLLKKPLRGRVLLTSLPGSGNTWVRNMLESATGVCTGSLWCDSGLRVRGMCGEGVRSPLLLVVKSHTHEVHWNLPDEFRRDGGATPYADAVIFIHRDPFAATISERHRDANDRKKSSIAANVHVSHAGPEAFGSNSNWQAIIDKQLMRWKGMLLHLVVKVGRRPVLLVKYEDLQTNATKEVLRMLEFLRMPHRPDQVAANLKEREFTQYYRNHTDDFEHYTPEQKKAFNKAILYIMDQLQQAGLPDVIGLKKYIRS